MTKKITKAVALVLVFSLLCIALVSCGKTLSGTYSATIGGDTVGVKTSYKFSGSKVTITVGGSVLGASTETSIEGTYEITEEDGAQFITLTFKSGDDASKYSGKHTFAENKDNKTITIDGVVYTKQ